MSRKPGLKILLLMSMSGVHIVSYILDGSSLCRTSTLNSVPSTLERRTLTTVLSERLLIMPCLYAHSVTLGVLDLFNYALLIFGYSFLRVAAINERYNIQRLRCSSKSCLMYQFCNFHVCLAASIVIAKIFCSQLKEQAQN